ncbi:MAG: SDR family NAD(P)-dependent oxidoreductase [Ginsengibacter sp.]
MAYALITGGSKGIGKAIAYNLATKNINLLLVARSEDLLNEISDDLSKKYGIEVKYLCVDLVNDNAAETIFHWVIKNNIQINILINNAGYGLSGNFEKYSAQAHVEMMNVNMTSLVKLISLFLPMMKQLQRSYILNIASSAAYQAVPYLSTYAASKSFVLSFSRALRYELRKTNVSVTCVSPGGAHTDFGHRADIGKKAIKAGEKLNMTPTEVAAIAVDSMFKKKREVITGFINKLGALLVWLTPKKWSENFAAKLYE